MAALVGLLIAATIATGTWLDSRTSTSGPSPVHCQETRIPVQVPHHPTTARLAAHACIPPAGHRTTTALLAIPGGGEQASFYDPTGPSGLPASHSLARAAADRGYTVVMLDRLGTGNSSRPPSKTVTYQAQVETVHQAAQLLHHRWHRLIGLGHSLGSGTIAGVAAHHPQDLDAVALTGYGPTTTTHNRHHTTAWQAAGKWSALDPGYITTRPHDLPRGDNFHNAHMTHRAWQYVGSTMDVLSRRELHTRPQGHAARSMAARIHAPVLLADGDHDAHYCVDEHIKPACSSTAQFRTWAHAVLPHTRHLTARLLPGTGHSWAYETTAPTAVRTVLAWVDDLERR